ncbi:OmpH family outer membrane protein [Maritimibacter sp. DP07]|uniref:OmpH family outer membrane protein n=1 Tax=Maritimibacter harenae TaxID=2606218 RepID=A0A845M266_9RHOB|nr:OmpH family outer membrane protein [Maritimibacter harenae]MZR13302.1 OmpH family outer membrane protein [Maritimibacter harenae]
MRHILILLATLAVLGTAGAPAPAQNLGQLVSPILTVDREALFERSQFGQRVSDDLEAESAALAEETRKIEQELEDEEQALTERRPSMSPEDFRAAADAFDEKVVNLREDRDAAQSDFLDRLDAAQRDFYNRIVPILGRLMQERGAVAVLEKRSVFLSVNAIDVTEEAIARIDEVLGDGSDLGDDAPAAPAPEATQRGSDN